eukprot:3009520-Prymnesium_polylepis.1
MSSACCCRTRSSLSCSRRTRTTRTSGWCSTACVVSASGCDSYRSSTHTHTRARSKQRSSQAQSKLCRAALESSSEQQHLSRAQSSST